MTKPKRGNCGTCHWFERGPNEPPKDGVWQGSCLVNPPIPFLMAQNKMVPGPKGMQQYTEPMNMTMLPMTQEDRRCSLWRPAGMLPSLATLSKWHNASEIDRIEREENERITRDATNQ